MPLLQAMPIINVTLRKIYGRIILLRKASPGVNKFPEQDVGAVGGV